MRPLLSICFAYLAPLAVFSYITDGKRPFLVSLYLIFAALAIVGVSAYKFIRRIPFSKSFIIIISCIIISSVAVLQTLFMFNFKYKSAKEFEMKSTRITAYVTKLHSDQSEYASFIAQVSEADTKDVNFCVSVFASFSPQISEGDIFVCDALLIPAEPSLYYNETMLKRQNILFTADIESTDYFEITGKRKSFLTNFDKLGDEIGYKFDRTFSKGTASLAKALLLGDRYELSEITERDFRRIGISHILALSGTHLVLIVGFIMYFLKFIITSDRLRFICVALIALFTMLITGASPSIMRAGLMLIYCQAGYLLRRRSDLMTALFAVTTAIVLADPLKILDAGLILSFAATFGIALFSDILRNTSLKLFGNSFDSNIPVKLLRYCFESLCISFFAGVFVTLASVFIFDYVSLVSAISTLIFTPVIIAFMGSCALTLLLSFIPPLSDFFLSASEGLCEAIGNLSSCFSDKDFICVSTGYPVMQSLAIIFIIVFLYFMIKDASEKRFAVFSLLFSLIFAFCLTFCITKDLTVIHLCVISSEKDDGIVLSNSQNNVYIDISGGSSASSASAAYALSNYRGTDIDVYMLTHYHFDHISALRKTNERLVIRKLLLPAPTNDTDKKYAASLEETAQKLGIDHEYYESDKALVINSVSITSYKPDRVSGSSHARIALCIEKAGEVFVYSAGYNEKCESFKLYSDALEKADFVIKGNHGPKANDTLMLSALTSAHCKLIVYPKALEDSETILRQTVLPYGYHEITSFSD